MSAQVSVYLGPARSGKSSELLRQYADLLRDTREAIGRALWLAPTGRSARQLRSQLLGQDVEACLAPGAMTFGTLARRILIDSQSRLRPIPPVMERELVRRSIRAALQSGELKFYDEAAKRDSFVDLVSEHIRELRRRGIAPSNYARYRPNINDRSEHQELALLYERYQQLLTGHALVDVEGLVWAAGDALSSPDAWPQNLMLVVADGFSDFTAGQHELLRILAQRTEELLISLPIELPAGSTRTGRSSGPSNRETMPRDDLFAKSASTLAALRRSFPKLSERQFASQPTAWPALDHIRHNVFQPPKRTRAASTGAIHALQRLEFVEAAGTHDEIVQIAQRIKRLLTTVPLREGQGEGPARPGDILVVFRSLGEAAPRVHDVFQQFGIPCFLETGRPLASAPIIKTLSALLQLHELDWPFRRTVAVITNNTLSAIDHSARRAADWLVRDLQIAEGRSALLERTRQLATLNTPPDGLSERAQRRIDEARLALAALEKLCAALDELPAEATASQWAAALARLGTQLGISPFVVTAAESQSPKRRTGRGSTGAPGDRVLPGAGSAEVLSDESIGECVQLDGAAHLDHIAWQLIVEHLASLERLDAWLGEPPRALTRRELITFLSDLAGHEFLPQVHDETGHVRVLS
ncbi:MAG TPA: UvrD-helicase domain-containing protein, partial [Lacipirellulaceae bacterium]